MVKIKNDEGGSTSATECDVLKLLNVECWKPVK
jgi:hypothetical protein